MNKKTKPIKYDDEMRPEYDLRKLRLVGRGIYAERFRRGSNLAQLIERDKSANEEQAEIDNPRPTVRFYEDVDTYTRFRGKGSRKNAEGVRYISPG